MNRNKGYELNLDSDVFLGLKTDFNQILNRTLTNMERKHSDEAEVSVNLKISVSSDTAPDFVVGNGAEREIARPKFVHKVASVMKIQEKKTGQVSGDYELVWDEESCQFIMKPIDNGQVSIDDAYDSHETDTLQLNPAKLQLENKNDTDSEIIDADFRGVADSSYTEDTEDDYEYDTPED